MDVHFYHWLHPRSPGLQPWRLLQMQLLQHQSSSMPQHILTFSCKPVCYSCCMTICCLSSGSIPPAIAPYDAEVLAVLSQKLQRGLNSKLTASFRGCASSFPGLQVSTRCACLFILLQRYHDLAATSSSLSLKGHGGNNSLTADLLGTLLSVSS